MKNDERNAKIIQARNDGLTFREIGERFGVSLERARQIVRTPEWRKKIDAKHRKSVADALGRDPLGGKDAPVWVAPRVAHAVAVGLDVESMTIQDWMRLPSIGKTRAEQLWAYVHGD